MNERQQNEGAEPQTRQLNTFEVARKEGCIRHIQESIWSLEATLQHTEDYAISDEVREKMNTHIQELKKLFTENLPKEKVRGISVIKNRTRTSPTVAVETSMPDIVQISYYDAPNLKEKGFSTSDLDKIEEYYALTEEQKEELAEIKARYSK